jgi:hypothetical protein
VEHGPHPVEEARRFRWVVGPRGLRRPDRSGDTRSDPEHENHRHERDGRGRHEHRPGEATAMMRPAARGPSRPPHASKIVLTALADVSSSGVSANSGMSDDWIGRGSVTRVATTIAPA